MGAGSNSDSSDDSSASNLDSSDRPAPSPKKKALPKLMSNLSH
jgi:hypothetical protein